MTYGIDALNVYGGVAQIPAEAVFAGRGLDPGRYGNLMMRHRSVALPFEDPVTHAVNAARPLVEQLDEAQRQRIELVVTATESGLDLSKSVASYVHRHLGLGPHCRLIELKQACYAATAGLQLAIGYLASGLSPGARILLIATDVALVDESAEYAEPATGSGAVAMVLAADPQVLAVDVGAFGAYSFEVLDSARPAPDLDIVDVDRSLVAYLTCLVRCFDDYRSRVADVDVTKTFDFLALHTPFAGMARAGHRKLMREYADASERALAEDFTARVAPSLEYPALVGNLFSGSLYLALASLVDHAPIDGTARVGLFSYGSGCSAEFFSGLIGPAARPALASMRIAAQLAGRAELTFDEYRELVPEHKCCLAPDRYRDVDLARWRPFLERATARGPLLALHRIDNHHREYDWI